MCMFWGYYDFKTSQVCTKKVFIIFYPDFMIKTLILHIHHVETETPQTYCFTFSPYAPNAAPLSRFESMGCTSALFAYLLWLSRCLHARMCQISLSFSSTTYWTHFYDLAEAFTHIMIILLTVEIWTMFSMICFSNINAVKFFSISKVRSSGSPLAGARKFT